MSSNRRLDGSSSSSVAHVTYEDLVRNSDLFWGRLYGLVGATKETLRLPKLGITVDLHRLFIEVTIRGGFKQVIQDRKWKEISLSLNVPASRTSASSTLKNIYESFLYEMECVYYIPKQDEAMIDEMPKLEQDVVVVDEPQIVGSSVYGFIDGKFEHGYKVTVKIGSEEMRGVLYHPGTSMPQPTNPPVLALPAPPPARQSPSPAPVCSTGPALPVIPTRSIIPPPPAISTSTAAPVVSVPPGFRSIISIHRRMSEKNVTRTHRN